MRRRIRRASSPTRRFTGNVSGPPFQFPTHNSSFHVLCQVKLKLTTCQVSRTPGLRVRLTWHRATISLTWHCVRLATPVSHLGRHQCKIHLLVLSKIICLFGTRHASWQRVVRVSNTRPTPIEVRSTSSSTGVGGRRVLKARDARSSRRSRIRFNQLQCR